jgi:hypothetical protein
MKLGHITEQRQSLMFKRTSTNIILANTVKKIIVMGTGRLKEPLKRNDINILNIFDAIKSQSCIRIANYKPDEYNKHLKAISVGPSYLEQQISRAIDKAVDQKAIPQSYVPYIRAEIGLDKEPKKKPEMSLKMRELLLKKQKAMQLKEDIDRQIQDLPGVKILTDLPPSRQSEHYSCGATVIQMVAAFYGKNIREADLIEKLGIGPNSGVKLSKIQQVAEGVGLKAHKAKLSYEEILKTLEDKIPMVVAVMKEDGDYHHFVLAIGYYDDGIVFRDPAKFIYGYMPKDEFFERCFGTNDRFLTLALASDAKPDYSHTEVEKT